MGASSNKSRASIIVSWEAVYGRPPPRWTGDRLLQLAEAYHQQARQMGGLSKRAQRQLRQWLEAKAQGGPSAKPIDRKRPLPGSRLVRDWHGETHVVDVLAQGFAYRGEHYRSLSQIARVITGARWSGPRFFGLR